MIISECFHANRLEPKYIYTDEYINFILEKIIFEKQVGSEQDLIQLLLNYYSEDEIKNSAIKKRMSELYGEKNKGKYYVSEQIIKKQEDFNLLFEKVREIYNLESFILNNSLGLNNSNYEKFESSLIIYLSLLFKSQNKGLYETVIFIYNYLSNFEIKYRELSNSINKIKKSYYCLSVYELFNVNEIIKRIFIKNNINTIEDLCSINCYNLMYLFSDKFEKNIKILEQLRINIKNVVEESFETIDEKNLEILLRRKGYISGEKATLEEIGTELNVTRERIRQLESKTIRKIEKIADDNNNIIISFYNSELGKRKPYIVLDRLINKYDESFINKILLLLEHGNLNITYDYKYQIIYDSSVNNIDNMINDVIEKIGVVAEPRELEQSDLFSLNVIKNNYRKITDELYLKNGCIYRDLFLDLIEELYPKGYYIGDDNEYSEFVNTVQERYKIFENIPSRHSLEAMIGRGNFIQVDRGKYISSNYSVTLPQDLIDNILNYISENEFTYYNAIFEKYKKTLKNIGVNNHYYLKGCLDPFLPEDMLTKRDYIICGNTNKTPYDIVINQLHSFEGKFSKNDLKNIFIGMKDYTIYNYLYSESDKGLIWISSNEFIYSDKRNIDEQTLRELKEFIQKLFNSLNTKLLTSKKIYAKLQLTNKELFNKLNLSNGHFELFSIMKAYYNDYYYSRPYIYLESNENNTRLSIIQNYVRKFDSFNLKMIQDYQSKMNIGGLYSYLEFMEQMSDEYVQVDLDEMIKIEKMNITESNINDIKKTIDLILDNFEVIDTAKFTAFSLFPKISHVWNKYLLIGIIRSYLSDYYDITNTYNTYTNTEFEVRRVVYE